LWEHRNLTGAGERLTLSAVYSEIGYSGDIKAQRPDFIITDQTLSLSARVAREDTDAYQSDTRSILLAIDRELHPGWIVGIGAGFKFADVESSDRVERFGLLYLPARSDWDRSNDFFDPTSGYRMSLTGAPYWDALNDQVTFFKSRAGAATYTRLSRRHRLDWAGRLSLGSISGATREAIPADERFYAGGGGTLRGYPYQSVGPLDARQKPLGGKSILLLSSEIRWRINEEFGAAVFVDGGNVFEESYPDEFTEFKWGAGAGLRYFTPVGPLRFDIAFPLNRRRGIDDDFQFYISLGQAF